VERPEHDRDRTESERDVHRDGCDLHADAERQDGTRRCCAVERVDKDGLLRPCAAGRERKDGREALHDEDGNGGLHTRVDMERAQEEPARQDPGDPRERLPGDDVAEERTAVMQRGEPERELFA